MSQKCKKMKNKIIENLMKKSKFLRGKGVPRVSKEVKQERSQGEVLMCPVTPLEIKIQ